MSVSTTLIPAGQGKAVQLEIEQRLKIVDLEGHQCVDVWAYLAGDVREYVSAEHTRTHVNKLFPQVGEEFVTNYRRPILKFDEDHSPGRHDMLFAGCDPARYLALGVEGEHGSCSENLLKAMAEFGHREIVIPQSINFFMSTSVLSDGTLEWDPILDEAGDYVVLQALLPCIVAISACPQDVTSLNDYHPTPVAIEVE